MKNARNYTLLILSIIGLASVFLLFTVNGLIWIYAYTLLWFTVISLIWIFVYFYLMKIKIGSEEELRNYSGIYFISILFFCTTLFINAISPIARDNKIWFITYWNLFRYSLFYFSILLLIILSISLFLSKQYPSALAPFHLIKRICNKKMIRYSLKSLLILIVALSIMFQAILFGFTAEILLPLMKIRAENNTEYLHYIVNDVTKDCITEEEKVVALLNWFDRHSGNIYNTYGCPGIGGNAVIKFCGEIHPVFLCVRAEKRNNPLWVLTACCGACEEHSLLFREMVHESGIKVRSVHCYEVDHCWDEVWLNDEWVVVDPANVDLRDNMTGYDMNASRYKYTHAKTDNLSYVFAEYSNKTIEDITYRYNSLSFVNFSTVDKNNNILPNVTITLLSNNREEGSKTELTFKTNNNGFFYRTFGAGNVTFKSRTKDDLLHNTTTLFLYPNEAYNLHVKLE